MSVEEARNTPYIPAVILQPNMNGFSAEGIPIKGVDMVPDYMKVKPPLKMARPGVNLIQLEETTNSRESLNDGSAPVGELQTT